MTIRTGHEDDRNCPRLEIGYVGLGNLAGA